MFKKNKKPANPNKCNKNSSQISYYNKSHKDNNSNHYITAKQRPNRCKSKNAFHYCPPKNQHHKCAHTFTYCPKYIEKFNFKNFTEYNSNK